MENLASCFKKLPNCNPVKSSPFPSWWHSCLKLLSICQVNGFSCWVAPVLCFVLFLSLKQYVDSRFLFITSAASQGIWFCLWCHIIIRFCCVWVSSLIYLIFRNTHNIAATPFTHPSVQFYGSPCYLGGQGKVTKASRLLSRRQSSPLFLQVVTMSNRLSQYVPQI